MSCVVSAAVFFNQISLATRKEFRKHLERKVVIARCTVENPLHQVVYLLLDLLEMGRVVEIIVRASSDEPIEDMQDLLNVLKVHTELRRKRVLRTERLRD